MKTTAIDLLNLEGMMVTWDTGRRCNYDCSYCELSRHDNKSSLHSYTELKKTFNFIKDWTSIYNKNRYTDYKTNINFTGGEPTINPNFWKLAEYIKDNESTFLLSLTTNGAWTYKNSEKIKNLFTYITISYHAEADIKLKKQVIENIKILHNLGIQLQVNVMLHVDFFNECVKLCDELTKLGIRHNPRPIGDGNIERAGWYKDVDGSDRRTSHSYTDEQQKWFFNYTGTLKNPNGNLEGSNLGRKCCGSRCTIGKVNNNWQEVKIIDTNFKDWNCMVDWFFLHIDQHTGLIYHHQTCQALYNKTRGPIGHIIDHQLIIDQLNLKFSQENKESIICPNQRCGCGMCIPKAKYKEDFQELWKKITNVAC